MNHLAPRLFSTRPALVMDDLFRELLEPGERERAWRPAVDLIETPEAYLIQVELAGIDPEEVEVTLDRDTLTLKGEKRSVERREGESSRVVERRYGSFSRTFRFPAPLAAELVNASSKHGLLTVEVKKAPEAQPRRITVQAQ